MLCRNESLHLLLSEQNSATEKLLNSRENFQVTYRETPIQS